MQVEIYTETTIRGPQVKSGKYAVIVACQTKWGPASRGRVYQEEATTFNRTCLLAILAGFGLLTRACEVTVHTPNRLIVTMIEEGNIEKWKREEWRRPQGKDLKNKELWQQLEEQLQKHKVTFVYTERSAYSGELEERMKER